MPLEEPSWWYRNPDATVGKLLAPLAFVYNAIAARRLQRRPNVRLPVPVICVGNFTAGGTGKTPFAIWLAGYLRQLGLRPAFLSRGYGGRITGPHQVQLQSDTAREVGDEPLLLAAHAPTVVSKDRGRGGEFIVSEDLGNVIIMDDGLQNPSLRKDLIIAVVSATRGIGNGQVIPAGPLRASLAQQLAVTDIILLNLEGRENKRTIVRDDPILKWLPNSFEGIVASASVIPSGETKWLTAQPLLAYAGIGNPDRFYDLVRQHGGTIREARSFRDHQQLTDADATQLLDDARRLDCQLVTTVKDLVRLDSKSAIQAELRRHSRTLDIELELNVSADSDFYRRLKAAVRLT